MKSIFLIKNDKGFLKVNNLFREFINQINSNKNSSIIEMDSLYVAKISTSLKKLDYYYQKKLDINDLDERFFIKERRRHLTPSKFTPFAK